jgi:hypothetical protein
VVATDRIRQPRQGDRRLGASAAICGRLCTQLVITPASGPAGPELMITGSARTAAPGTVGGTGATTTVAGWPE